MHKTTKIAAAVIIMLAAAACKNTETYSWERDLQYRLETDFCRSRQDVETYIKKYIPDVTEKQIDEWTESGKLESMMIGGERKYFRNAAPNLFRIDERCREIKFLAEGPEQSPHYVLGVQNIANIAEDYYKTGLNISEPVKMRVRYTLTVDADAVPDGETIRCWLPYPRTDAPRQTSVRFISAGWKTEIADGEYENGLVADSEKAEGLTFSGDGCAHSTLYMEATAKKGCPTEFYEEFEYVCSGEWYPLDTEDRTGKAMVEHPTGLNNPENYVGEREKHIIFTPEILALRDSLAEGITDKVEQARAFYKWIDANFPWASAREYSTIPNIPEYVLASGHGDCGQVSLLFITLCRASGIPARFQSGFMVHPGNNNLHDWSEIWIDEYGWVPVDQSFGGDSYFGGMDSYRLIVNCDYGRDLVPAKKYPRSETVDFQRGEVEWEEGNLYFPMWDYDLEVEYL